MAAKNFLIGIGGTGARVIESIVHLCAAGLGPDELSVFVVDPDAGNGNLNRTKKLITEYKNIRKGLQKTGSCTLFKTNISIPPGDNEFVWEIFSGNNPTLSDYINFTNLKNTNRDLSDFTTLLFTEDELSVKLDEGFRGHPAIGAVVMANPPQDKYPFKMIWDEMSDKKPNDVKVFIVGSVFGGTGAAGFPTLGSKNLIKFNDNAKIGEKESRVLMGGALVLPYFSFEVDSTTTEKLFVTTNDFPIATKAALQYYNEKDLGFDQIYFIGDSLGQKVGQFGVGSGKQNNMPHYIEMVTSLAAFDFFDQDLEHISQDKMLFTATRESEIVSWTQLPFSRYREGLSAKQIIFKTGIANMTVFSYVFLTYGIKILNSGHDSIKDAWYKDYFQFKTNEQSDKDPRNNKIDEMERFLRKFLFWICAMDDASMKVELVDRNMLIDGDLSPNNPTAFKLSNPEAPSTLGNIGNLLKNASSKNLDFNMFKIEGLNNVEFKDTKITQAYSKLVNIFYDASLKFNKLNYNIN